MSELKVYCIVGSDAKTIHLYHHLFEKPFVPSKNCNHFGYLQELYHVSRLCSSNVYDGAKPDTKKYTKGTKQDTKEEKQDTKAVGRDTKVAKAETKEGNEANVKGLKRMKQSAFCESNKIPKK